jgi:2-oxoisovalerate dehydrogenase E1 component
MMQEVLEKQGGFHWLDAEPRTLTAQPHRPAYGSDGGYFSKPNAEQLFTAVYEQMNEADPVNFPIFIVDKQNKDTDDHENHHAGNG